MAKSIMQLVHVPVLPPPVEKRYIIEDLTHDQYWLIREALLQYRGPRTGVNSPERYQEHHARALYAQLQNNTVEGSYDA